MKRHIDYCHSYGVLGAVVNDPTPQLYGPLTAEENKGLINLKTTNDFLRLQYSIPIDDQNESHSGQSFSELCSILQKRGRKKAVVVANGRQAVGEALIAGCDAIEQGYGMDEDNLRIMAQKGVLWIPSLMQAKNALDGSGSASDAFCRFSHRYQSSQKPVPGAKKYWAKTLDNQMQLLKTAKRMGVEIAIGTGAGCPGILHGEAMVEEMKLFKKAGLSLEATFKCASENGAKFFNMKELGALSVGAKATFLIARGAVQQLPRKLSYLEAVYVNGNPSAYYCKNPVVKS
jgi:imidazolonepropionase-like amidohydrolase